MTNSARLIDFHSHILPGVDHGSSGIQETADQMRMIQVYGVDTMVATPHFYPNEHGIESFLDRTNRAAALIKEQELPAPPCLHLGAEVLFCEGIDRMEGLERLCIRGTDLLLLELPLDHWDYDLFETVDNLLRRHTVVLAHIDRYLFQWKNIQMLLDMGALAQINAESLFSFGSRHRLSRFLKEDSVVALGSDLHKVDEKTYQKFATAEKHLGSLYTEIMERSAYLLKNAENFLAE